MENVSIEFYGVYVLTDMQLQVEHGSVHALVGENGAGKSTLMKILGGIYKPNTGNILIDGEKVVIHNVQDAQRKGISIIHQEISLVPSLLQKIYFWAASCQRQASNMTPPCLMRPRKCWIS